MNDEKIKKVEENLNKIISTNLYEALTDPGKNEIWSALYAYDCLKLLGLIVNNEADIIESFKPNGNSHQYNFWDWRDKTNE